MRDPADNVTAEIPGLPAKPRRLSLAERQAAAGYYLPKDAPSCRHCQHRPPEGERQACKLHGWPVLLGGICGKWSPA